MSGGVLTALDDVIDSIADLDVDALSDVELDELVVGLGRARHRLAGVTAPVLARWDTAGVWKSDGSRTATTRLARDCGTSPTTAAIRSASGPPVA